MSKSYRPWNPDQDWLLPPSPRDWLPEGDLVYMVLEVVRTLDISAILNKYEKDDRGQPPFHPRMMAALLVYAYCTGVYSSRRIQRACERDAGFRVLVGDDAPNFRTISDFRRLHLGELEGLFVQVLRLCAEAGMVKLGHVSLDGSKVKANASRHKAMSYKRMKQEQQRLHEEISSLLAKAEATDEAEDVTHGIDVRGDELPDELARRQSRLEKIAAAKAALEEEARVLAEFEEQRRRKQDEERRAAGKKPVNRKPVQREPDPKAQHNFTDPESNIMKTSQGFDQCGNAQIAATEEQIIVASDVTREPNDKQQLEPMVQEAKSNLEAAGVDEKIETLTADSGYYSQENVSYLEGEDIDPYIATERLRRNEQAEPSPRGPIPTDMTPKQRMARKLRTKKGRETYAKRKGTVEPVFGQIKQARGFRQFLLRGLDKMRGEWSLVCMAHNVLKLYGSGWALSR